MTIQEWMIQMKKLDRYEREVLGAYEKGALVSVRLTKANTRGTKNDELRI